MILESYLCIATKAMWRALARPHGRLLYSTLLPLVSATFSLSAATTPPPLQYNRDIRPILAENCFSCHGPDSASRKAGLRLDRFEDATAPIKDSSPAIVPGKPEASELIRRINAHDTDDLMPPAKTKKTLTHEQLAKLKAWVAQGAKYEPHWSLIAATRPAVPAVKNRRWASNPIDNFILSKLEQEGLKPAPEADRRTLIRRVTLDLTGLPPAPADVEAFVKDSSPNAYEKVVDRLLASPQYGEHRAHYWLDAARYGDTHGIHMDNFREIWSYREWVINAFNRNETFDQFTIEQLAGDLLPNPTLDQKIASGFNRCNITTSEGGAINEEYLVFYARDRTETTSQVWLGLTAGCAVCHDHKFDRLSQKEFYSLSAYFNNTAQPAMDGNIKNTPPVMVVPLPKDRPVWEKLDPDKLAADEMVKKRRETAKPEFAGWITNATPETFSAKLPKDEPMFRALLADNKTQMINITIQGVKKTIALATNANAKWQDGVLAKKAYNINSKTTPQIPEAGDFEKDKPFSYCAWINFKKEKDGSLRTGALAARMDDTHDFRGWDFWIEGGKPGTHIISKWPDDALKVVANNAIEPDQWTHVCVTYDGSAKAAGVKIYIDGVEQPSTPQADKLAGSIHTTVPLKIGQRDTSSPLDGSGVQDLRLYSRVLPPPEIKALAQDSELAYLLTITDEKRTKKQKDQLYNAWLSEFDREFQEDNARRIALQQQEKDIIARGTEAHVMQERPEPAKAFVLSRGEYDKHKDEVVPGTPAALPAMPADYPRNRLGFARWLLLPENPLPMRVTVNRFWQELFGTGIVKSSGDFGVTGDLPSHPELLDWLAVDFRENGWDIKRFFKLMAMSSTYRQSAVTTPDKLAKDQDNRLLSRGPRFRMDAEMIRDYALSASGLLVEKIGGPSVRPYQPDGVWEAVAMIGSNTRDYKRDAGESLYRRSLYTFWKRAAPPASMEIFNAPSRETCTVRRERGDTPLQALVTLDDPQFVEAARHLAQETLEKSPSSDRERLDFMAERVLARPLRSKEMKITSAVLKDLLAHYKAAPKDADALLKTGDSPTDAKLDKPTLAAYAMVASELLNLDEALNK